MTLTPIGDMATATLTEAEGGIPNSPVYDNAADIWLFDEGEGSTVANSADGDSGSIDGATWTADSESVGGYKLGNFGWVDFPKITNIIDPADTYSLAITADGFVSNNAIWAHTDASPNHQFILETDNSLLKVGHYNGSNWEGRYTNTTPSTRFRLGISAHPNDGNIAIYIDGDAVDDGTTTSFALNDGTDGHRIGSSTDDFGVYGEYLDAPVTWDTMIGSSGFSDDYEAQPWS